MSGWTLQDRIEPMAPGTSSRGGFVAVTRRDSIVPGRATLAVSDGTAIALYDVGGRILAMDDLCACCGSSLAEGALDGTIVACRRCGWRYDIVTGAVEGLPALRLECFAVKIEGGEVLVATGAARDS